MRFTSSHTLETCLCAQVEFYQLFRTLAGEHQRPTAPFLEFSWASIAAAWTGQRYTAALSCTWKNDAWSACSSHDTNQMNGAFTYSDNKAALESHLAGGAGEVSRSGSQRAVTPSRELIHPMIGTWLGLTGRGITQPAGVFWKRFVRRKWEIFFLMGDQRGCRHAEWMDAGPNWLLEFGPKYCFIVAHFNVGEKLIMSNELFGPLRQFHKSVVLRQMGMKKTDLVEYRRVWT